MSQVYAYNCDYCGKSYIASPYLHIADPCSISCNVPGGIKRLVDVDKYYTADLCCISCLQQWIESGFRPKKTEAAI
mgnify:CR=1 FL=1